MATETLKLLNRAGAGMARAVGSGETVLYTTPAGTTTVIKKACLCNYSNADITFKLWHVESGTTTSDGAILMGKLRNIPANQEVWIDMPVILNNLGTADTLIAQASNAPAFNISLYGSEVV